MGRDDKRRAEREIQRKVKEKEKGERAHTQKSHEWRRRRRI